MSSQEMVPTLAGIVMLVFGGALAAALAKGIVMAIRRRSWPIVEGHVTLPSSSEGRKAAIARIRYTAPDGLEHAIETPTGGLGSSGRDGTTMPMRVDPTNADHAIPATTSSNLTALGCFALVSLFFALFGLFALIRVFTN